MRWKCTRARQAGREPITDPASPGSLPLPVTCNLLPSASSLSPLAFRLSPPSPHSSLACIGSAGTLPGREPRHSGCRGRNPCSTRLRLGRVRCGSVKSRDMPPSALCPLMKNSPLSPLRTSTTAHLGEWDRQSSAYIQPGSNESWNSGFSIGIFQWIRAKSKGGLKKGRTIKRVKGSRLDPEKALREADRIVAMLNNKHQPARWTHGIDDWDVESTNRILINGQAVGSISPAHAQALRGWFEGTARLAEIALSLLPQIDPSPLRWSILCALEKTGRYDMGSIQRDG